MPAKWHKYSYSAQRAERRSVLSVILIFLVLLILFSIISRYIYSTYEVSSSTMEPALLPGDYIVTTPLVNMNISVDAKKSWLFTPVRGDLIVLNPSYELDLTFYKRFINSLVSFMTLQRFRPFEDKNSWGENHQIRRIIGFPGDSLYIENFIVHIKPANSEHYLTEFELSEYDYDIRIDKLPDNWNTDLPFSGSSSIITLSPDEFYVMSDNRLSSSDSRVWGPINKIRIGGRVLFRYWPFNHFGKP